MLIKTSYFLGGFQSYYKTHNNTTLANDALCNQKLIDSATQKCEKDKNWFAGNQKL